MASQQPPPPAPSATSQQSSSPPSPGLAPRKRTRGQRTSPHSDTVVVQSGPSTNAAATSPAPPSRKRKRVGAPKLPKKKTSTKKKTAASDEWYLAHSILEETRTHYLIEWVGTDPETGNDWVPTWEPKANANDDLVREWLRDAQDKLKDKRDDETDAQACKYRGVFSPRGR